MRPALFDEKLKEYLYSNVKMSEEQKSEVDVQ